MTPRFRIFFDMDGVLVDFERFMRERNMTAAEVKEYENAFAFMHPLSGAIDGIRKVMSIAGQYGGEVWIATKPPTGIAHAYAGKAEWILDNLPELKRRIIITHDKGLLGGADDFLIDDRPWRANCGEFRGTLVWFGTAAPPPDVTVRFSYSAVDWAALGTLLKVEMRERHEARIRVAGTTTVNRDADHSLEDINDARDLLRLGHLTPAETLNKVRAREGLAPLADHFTQAGVDAVMGPGYEVVPIATRPAHGGYPGDARPAEGEHAIAELAHQRVTPLPFKVVSETTPPVGRFGGGRFGEPVGDTPKTLHTLAQPCVQRCMHPLTCSGVGKCVGAGQDSAIGRAGAAPGPEERYCDAAVGRCQFIHCNTMRPDGMKCAGRSTFL